jgi:hypothetical protein
VEGRVCDAEEIACVVRRPERVEVSKGGCAPDLRSQQLYSEMTLDLTLIIGSVALEKRSFWSCDRQKPSTLPLWAWITLRRPYVSRL